MSKAQAASGRVDHGLAKGSSRRLFAVVEPCIPNAADATRLDFLRVPDLSRFVDLLAGEAEVSGGRERKVVPVQNDFRPSSLLPNLGPLLRRVVLLRQLAFPIGAAGYHS